MLRILFSIACLITIVTPVSAAQDNIRPGLWKVTTTSDLLALVPHIPSEHMQQIDNLARQYGLIMPKIQNNAATSQVCITQAMAHRKFRLISMTASQVARLKMAPAPETVSRSTWFVIMPSFREMEQQKAFLTALRISPGIPNLTA